MSPLARQGVLRIVMTQEMLLWIISGFVVGGILATVVTWLVTRPRTKAEYDKVRIEIAESRKAAERESQKIIAIAQDEAKSIRQERNNFV